MKYPDENDSYGIWLKHYCKVLLTTWKRKDCAQNAVEKIGVGIKEILSGLVELLFYIFGPVITILAPLLSYYARKSYIKRREHMNKLEDDTIKSYRSNCSVRDNDE